MIHKGETNDNFFHKNPKALEFKRHTMPPQTNSSAPEEVRSLTAKADNPRKKLRDNQSLKMETKFFGCKFSLSVLSSPKCSV